MQNKTVLITFCVVSLWSATMFAGNLTITPQYTDLTPNDGFMDAGTWSNPLIVENDHGTPVGRVQPRYHDLTPNDGFMDAGTTFNPLEVELY